jgi:hypothetical protein
MHGETRDWLEGLRGFAGDHRAGRETRVDTGMAAESAAAARAAERGILATHLVSWFDGIGTWTAARRAFAPRADADPAVVLTTSPVGIEAAAELCAMAGTPASSLRSQVVAVTELEYRLWCIRHPDETFRLHVNHWNWLKTDVPPQRHAEFAAHPLGAGECYWLHRSGTAGTGEADRRDCHLWKWNGRHAALLQTFVRERPGAPAG